MAFADWFRPKWRHSNPSIRVVAVKGLTSPATLARVAREDAEASIRSVAVEMLSDQGVLGEVAKADADVLVRTLALGRVTEAAVLADIVQQGRHGDTRTAALARLTEPELLGEVAKKNDDVELRKSATLRVTDPAVLAEIVRKDPEVSVRQVAVPRVTDATVLAEIVKTESDVSIRQFAISRVDVSQVTDELVLAEVAKRHEGPASRKAAAVRITGSRLLMEIADGAEDKDLRELALRRVTDQSLLATAVVEGRKGSLSILKHVTDGNELARIARTATERECREKAVARIEDETVLAEIASSDRDVSIRIQASKRLPLARWKELLAVLNAKKSDVLAAAPGPLAEIARKALDEDVRSAAVMRLADGTVLAQVAENDPSNSVRQDAQRRIVILACEQREAQGIASAEDLRDIGLYYLLEDPRKTVRYLTDVIGRTAWLGSLPWQDRMTIYEARAAANLALRLYDPAISDFDQAVEECKQPDLSSRVLRKRAACYTAMGMEEQAQKDRVAAAKVG